MLRARAPARKPLAPRPLPAPITPVVEDFLQDLTAVLRGIPPADRTRSLEEARGYAALIFPFVERLAAMECDPRWYEFLFLDLVEWLEFVAPPSLRRGRRSMSPRLRFEIQKRDGFRCRYCGATPETTALHVDHVVPVAAGGTNDPRNLLTACAGCNLGKSAVPLDESGLVESVPAEELRARARETLDYLQACAELEDTRDSVREDLSQRWEAATRGRPSRSMQSGLFNAAQRCGLEMVYEAIAVIGRRRMRGDAAARYFYGVLRNMTADRGGQVIQ